MKVRIVEKASWIGKIVDIPDDALAITIERVAISHVLIYWLEKVEEVAVNEREQVKRDIERHLQIFKYRERDENILTASELLEIAFCADEILSLI